MENKHGIAALYNFYRIAGSVEPRFGSELDIPKLKDCLQEYCNFRDPPVLNEKAFLQELDEVATDATKKQSCKYLVVFISSHGGYEKFQTSDGRKISEKQVFEKFKDLTIPKVFIFQFCRGQTHDIADGNDNGMSENVRDTAYNINLQNLLENLPGNSIVLYSTSVDRLSLRNTEVGGSFIDVFEKAFQQLKNEKRNPLDNDTYKLDVIDIFTAANLELSRQDFHPTVKGKETKVKCVAQFASTLNERFYFDGGFKTV